MKNRLAKSVLLILVLLCVTHTGTARNVCDLASPTAPLLLNLRVGMSPEQARAVFGKALKVKAKSRGEHTFFQNYIKKKPPELLRGVRALYLRFFDNRLYQIEVFYESRPDLSNLETTVGELSAQLNLPVADWRRNYDQSEIKCGEFALIADFVLNPRVQLTDETIRATVEAAREKTAKK